MKTLPVKNKWVEPTKIQELVTNVRSSGKTIATLNGSFDLMHAGHLYILFEAAKQADVLIVLLNTDSSIARYKSIDRPIIPLQYRLEMVAAIACVDYVSWFDETDPRKILSLIAPDVHVNGAEYEENCIEAETVKAQGGKLYLVDRIEGLATSQIIQKIKALCD